MITAQTATDIALAHREIEKSKKLLKEIQDIVSGEKECEDLRDVFGRRKYGLELGVPTGESSRRIFNLSWDLAMPVIQAHIIKQEAELLKLNEAAKAEAERVAEACDE